MEKVSYVVVDFEFNQYFDFGGGKSPADLSRRCPSEIIQIGAVLMNDDMTLGDRFMRLIRPQIYRRLHPHVERLTKITPKRLSGSPRISEIFGEFAGFVAGRTFLIWGPDDMTELYRNIVYFGLSYDGLPTEYINVQKMANIELGLTDRQVSLKNAVEALDIAEEHGPFHDALSDAVYTGVVFKTLVERLRERRAETELETRAVSAAQVKLAAAARMENISTKRLFTHVQTALGRTLTDDEKMVALAAYSAGTAKKFTRKTPPNKT